MPRSEQQLVDMASHFATRRETILKAWRRAVRNDPELTTPTALSRTQFVDHIPALLDAFQDSLLAGSREAPAAAEEHGQKGADHGIHRWQQGYNLRELIREWGHLQLCLVYELENYVETHPELSHTVTAAAHRALASLCVEGVNQSTARFLHMRQVEAASQVRDLEQDLTRDMTMGRRQAEMLRGAAHDLRGNLNVVAAAAKLLSRSNVTQADRDELFALVKRAVESQTLLLTDLMDLARLEAGQERRTIEQFDAATVLGEWLETARPLAAERGLSLEMMGPKPLLVEGDVVNVRRIAQNLLLNSLKYTQAGGVTVTWGDSRDNDPKRWMLCVEDTGPGFGTAPSGPLATALKQATEESLAVEKRDGGSAGGCDDGASTVSAKDAHPAHQRMGEGIGLLIVKRLCELLDASLEMESKPSTGTAVRIIFPRRYENAEEDV